MREKNVPPRLWDLAYVYVCNLRNLVARGRDKQTGYEKITGDTTEIGEYIDYDFYDWVYYWDSPSDPENPHLGR